MDHKEATETHAVERYLLGELPGSVHAQFEQHFFECTECAADVLAAAQLLDGVARELGTRRPDVAATAPEKRRPARRTSAGSFLWPALSAAAAVVLLLTGYRSWVSYGKLRDEVTALRRPSIVSAMPIMGGNSRGAALMTLSSAQPIVLSIDIPAAEPFSSYDCTLLDSSDRQLWSLPVSAEQAHDTVSIGVPTGNLHPGSYTVVVHGFRNNARATPVELVRHRFKVVSTD